MSLGQKAPGQGTQHPELLRAGRWHAVTGHSAQWWWCKWTFGRWTQPRALISATPPPKETTHYGTNKMGWRPGQTQEQIQ